MENVKIRNILNLRKLPKDLEIAIEESDNRL